MRKFLSLSVIVLTACATAQQLPAAEVTKTAQLATPNTIASKAQTQEQRFMAWKHDFMARAISKGHNPSLIEQTIGRAKFKASAVSDNASQPEFVKPIWSYVKTAASPTRLKNGNSKLAEHTTLFDSIEARYGVDRNVLTAIWGLESAFGEVQGSYDAVNVLSTFAFEGRRTKFGEEQLFALLDLLTAGDITQSQLKSSWAGAMGMTQFIPATFRDYAVDFDGNGNKDLWNSEADALASAANYLSRFGWVPTQPAFAEVSLPAQFDYSLADGQNRSIYTWQALGVKPFHGGGFTQAASMIDGKLYLPAGAKGPALLTFKNFDVIKRYNNSNSYAMGISSLGMNLAGKSAIMGTWPEGDTQISRTQKKTLQEALTAQGFDTGGIDGAIGPMSQKAIRGWQAANNVPADGYVELGLYKRIVSQANMKP